ncbi:hypothetical protein AVEN_15498-1, partial [Araneus ventricosus]
LLCLLEATREPFLDRPAIFNFGQLTITTPVQTPYSPKLHICRRMPVLNEINAYQAHVHGRCLLKSDLEYAIFQSPGPATKSQPSTPPNCLNGTILNY